MNADGISFIIAYVQHLVVVVAVAVAVAVAVVVVVVVVVVVAAAAAAVVVVPKKMVTVDFILRKLSLISFVMIYPKNIRAKKVSLKHFGLK